MLQIRRGSFHQTPTMPQVPGHHLQASPAEMEKKAKQRWISKKNAVAIISQRPEYIQTPAHARDEILSLMGRCNGSLREKKH